jgi:membrane peptidoglycan carboxypeptidase
MVEEMSSESHYPAYHRDDPDGGADAHDSYRQYQDSYAVDSYGTDPYPADGYRNGAGRAVAAVGNAAAGRARVTAPPPTAPDDQPRPRYNWSGAGRPAVAGRATVPVSPAVGPPVPGRATGRATVRPGGPGAPGGPRPRAAAAGRPPTRRKRHWLRNSLLIALAVLVMVAGGGMVALSYYVDSVPPPEQLDLAEASTVLYQDGREMAALREVNREIIDTTVPELKNLRDAVVAAEDQDFYEHSGVDFAGIVRAAWNNVTGGERQGASTIDQQYARAAADLSEDSYRRKLKEAAMAYKMNQELGKEKILDFYLNTIYLGRGAWGVQAAARAYFDKPAAELSVAEAAVIAGVIRVPDDGSGLSPYDPLYPSGPEIAQERWGYVLDQMVEIKALDPATRAELTELPEVVEPPGEDEPFKGPQGNIVRQVTYELERMGITDLTTGGYRITTTIDRQIQKAARDAARRKNDAAHWNGMPDNVDAAMVAIDPASGAVLAYYGGEDGVGFDLAGPNRNEETGEWYGGRAPGSSFKAYTLIAELREGVSFDSYWKTSEYEPEWLSGKTIRNAGRVATECEGRAPDYCTLRWSTQLSYNVPFAYFSEAVPDNQGPAKILQAAKDAGIRLIKDTREGITYDLTGEEATDLAPEHFFHPIAYGQYPITVLDHASGVATLAARGVYNEPHFVASVEQKVNGEWVPIAGDRISGEQRVEQQYADAITGVLSTIPGVWGFSLAGGRPAAAKTGTWEFDRPDDPRGGNNDAWVVGYTPQIAAAVWVGDATGEDPIKDQFGGDIGSSGLPAQIWRQFMDQAHAAKEYQHQGFAQAPPVGNPQHPYANGEQAPPEPRDRDLRCRLPFVQCDDDDDGDDDDDDGDGDGDDGEGGEGGEGGEVQPPPGDGT